MHTEANFVRHEKFRLIQAISAMLHDAPSPVRRAWQEGWTGIAFYPNGYTSMDSCGCCFTDYPPGWYGYSTETRPDISKYFREEFLQKWEFICDPKGGQAYDISCWDILDSH